LFSDGLGINLKQEATVKRPVLVAFLLTIASFTGFAELPLNITMSGNRITGTGDNVYFDLANPGQEAAITHVFNLQGEEIAELSAESMGRFVWDGRDTDEQPVEAGLYVVQIRHGGEVWHGPVVVRH
jgi:hypothetical protein